MGKEEKREKRERERDNVTQNLQFVLKECITKDNDISNKGIVKKRQ